MKKIKPRNLAVAKREKSPLNEFLKIQLFALLCYVCVFIIGSISALMFDISSEYDYIFTLIIFALSSFIVGFFAGLKIRKNGLIVGMLYSLPLNLIITVISTILNHFSVGINIAITLIILSITSGIGGIMAVNKRIRIKR